jgi:hypothetical protein
LQKLTQRSLRYPTTQALSAAEVPSVGSAPSESQADNENGPFELQGEFRGFQRNVGGKRRLVLRIGDKDEWLKAEKKLRKHFEHRLIFGQAIIVTGERWPRVDHLEILTAPVPPGAHSVIRVCTESHCWKRGARELWQQMAAEIEEAGLSPVVKLKSAACMDHCKRGPNVIFDGCFVERCTPEQARKFLRSHTI